MPEAHYQQGKEGFVFTVEKGSLYAIMIEALTLQAIQVSSINMIDPYTPPAS